MVIQKTGWVLLCLCANTAWSQIKIDRVIKEKRDKIKEATNVNTTVPEKPMIKETGDAGLTGSAFNGSAYAVKTFVGSGYSTGGANANGYKEGSGKSALFDKPAGITADEDGNLYLADRNNYCIRKITADGTVSTLAGKNEQGAKNGMGTEARFFDPSSIWYDGKGFFYVAESGNHAVRKISKEGKVTTVVFGKRSAGYKDGAIGIAEFSSPSAAVTDSKGNVLVLDQGNHCIRKISGTEVSTFVGSARSGHKDGKGQEAQFDTPFCMVIDASDNLYVLEKGRQRVRRISADGTVVTFDFEKINEGHGLDDVYKINAFQSIAINKTGKIYVTDGVGRCIHEISANGKDIQYLLTGTYCKNHDNDAVRADAYASEAVDGQDCKGVLTSDNLPGICETAGGKIYFIDAGFCCVRELVR